MMMLSSVYNLTANFCGGGGGTDETNSIVDYNNHDNGNDSDDDDTDYYEDDEDEMLLRDFDYCNSQKIIELTLRRDYVLVKLQEFVDADTEMEAARALQSIQKEGTANLTNISMIKFLIRAGMYEIITDAVHSKQKFIISTSNSNINTNTNENETNDNNDYAKEIAIRKTPMPISTENGGDDNDDDENENDPNCSIHNKKETDTTAVTAATASVLRGGLSPLIAKPLLETLSYYHNEREERRNKKKQQRRKYAILLPRSMSTSWNTYYSSSR